MRRVALRENVQPEFIREEVARGRLVIPANKRHLAGSGGKASALNGIGGAARVHDCAGGSSGSGGERESLGQSNRGATLGRYGRSDCMRGERAPKRLDPMGIGRMITTKINANIGASPVASGTDAEVEKLHWAQQLRRRHADGPLHRRQPRRVPPGDHRPQHDPDRHRADLLR